MSLMSHFDPSTVILTANSRLAQSLKQTALAQSSVAVLPQIMSFSQWWSSWLDEVFLRGELSLEQMNQRHLNAFEAQVLWEEVLNRELSEWATLKSDPQAQTNDDLPAVIELLNPASTAKQLYQAWSLRLGWLDESAWQAALAHTHTSQEVALFERCVPRYRALLERHHWLDEPLLSQQRLAWLAEGKGALPAKFYVVGFDELTPELSAWQAIVEQRKSQALIELPMEHNTQDQPSLVCHPLAQHQLFAAADAVDEAQQVALWCVEQWAFWSQRKAAHSVKIGVVAPNLADHKALLTQALDEQLYLAGLQPLRSMSVQPPFYNLSLGEPLSQLPLVSNALLGVELLLQPHKPCSFAHWSQWLISPYTLGDVNARQTLEAKWRGLQWAEFKWPKLLERSDLSDSPALQSPGLVDLLRALQKQAQITLPSQLSLSDFVCAVRDCLGLFNQASRTLNSDEYQQDKALQSALDGFSRLLFLKPSARLGEWLSRLKRYVGEQVHQSQSKGLQPLQLMGVLEAGGQSFDALWVMGLTDEAWPRSPNPNPFLPMRLQREAGLPRCDALRELVYAQRISARLKTAAPNIVWSYARQNAGAVLLPSPLLADLVSHADSADEASRTVTDYLPKPYQTLAQVQFSLRDATAPLEWVEDAVAPPMPEHSHAPGGTSILQAQSQCPLMAFIDYRLGARFGLQTVTDGLQNTHQGTLIHLVLQRFWEVTRSQTALLALSPEALQSRLSDLISQAFSELHGQLTAAYVPIEQARILELCLAWLTLEKTRPSFEVLALETTHLITLAGLEFKVIIDRVDRVNAQSGTPQTFILDYKTGTANIANLLKTPTKAPQLAVYLHALNSLDELRNIGGIGYGLLHSDDGVKLSALCESVDILPKSRAISVFSELADKENGDYYQVAWGDFLEALRQQVLDLALQIKQGSAPMQFERLDDVQYAHGRLALRLPEVTAQWHLSRTDDDDLNDGQTSDGQVNKGQADE